MIINPFLIKPTPYLYALSVFFLFFLFSCDSKKQVRPDVLAPSNPDSSATVVINFLNRKPTRYPIKLRISSPERKTTYRELTQQGQPYKINIKEVRSEVEMHFRLIHMQNNGKTCKYSKMISLKPESETKMNYDLNEPVASKCFLNFIGGISGLKWKDDASELDPENWESFAIDEFTNIWVNHSKWLKLCFHKGKLFCYEKIFKVYPITPGPDRPSLTILADAERELKNSQKPSEILFNGNEAIFWSSSGVDTALIYYPISPIEKNDFVGIRYNHVVSAVYLPVYNKFKSGEFVRSGNVVDRVLGKYIPERTN